MSSLHVLALNTKTTYFVSCARFTGGRCGADILEDPAIKARFQEVVAESVRQQLEALANAPASSTRQLEAGDRSAGRQQVSHYGHRER